MGSGETLSASQVSERKETNIYCYPPVSTTRGSVELAIGCPINILTEERYSKSKVWKRRVMFSIIVSLYTISCIHNHSAET
jgi:hypothetical protein